MDKTFKGEFIPFYIRLLKRLAPVFLLVLFCLFKLYYGRFSTGSFVQYRIYFLIFLTICFLIGIYYHTDKIRTVVNEVQLSDTKFYIIGQDFNSKYKDSLDISKTTLEIQSEELGKDKTRYCLEIYSEDKFYYLNKFNDWHYTTLVEIVDEYQLKTGKSVAGMHFYPELKESR
jgi:hypothetical protein